MFDKSMSSSLQGEVCRSALFTPTVLPKDHDFHLSTESAFQLKQLLDDYIKVIGIDSIANATGWDLAALQDSMTWCEGDRNTQKRIIALFDAKKSQIVDALKNDRF